MQLDLPADTTRSRRQLSEAAMYENAMSTTHEAASCVRPPAHTSQAPRPPL